MNAYDICVSICVCTQIHVYMNANIYICREGGGERQTAYMYARLENPALEPLVLYDA